jgi:hypothetical protein
MNGHSWIRILFGIAAAYDGLLGLVFLAAPGYPFERFGVTPPNHMGYVQFPAALLIVFAIMFFNLARDPAGRRELIVYAVLLKAAYCGVAGWYWMTASLPMMWKPFVVIDVVMAVLFVQAYRLLDGHVTLRAA